MDIDVLGGLDVRENGVRLSPASPSERQVLAVLAAYADQVVPVAVLAEELGAYTPPGRAHSVLESCVRLLRRRLAAAVAPGAGRTARTVLARMPGGYFLDTGGGRLDLREFERGAAAGHRAMSRGEYATAACLLRGALGLWKGPAFDGVPPGPRLAERVAELEATRKAVMEQWVEARLALDRQRERTPDFEGPPESGPPESGPPESGPPESAPPESGLPQVPGLWPLPRQFTPIGAEDTGRQRMRSVRPSIRTAPAAAPDRRDARSTARRVRGTPTR
ncbi:BTAD domain-containing putative transcriptional regulator [Streptomyces sp. NPDC059874]|uniref:AfsR/SARP family transcriptional regulator n=1 Tax=Streptomyces sp. NPDC059874 TaxID=3346983 RepID=UPI00365A149B